MSAKTNPFYVDPKEFLADLVDHFQKLAVDPELQWPNNICRAFMLIVDGLGNNYRFRNYTYLDEMKSDALETMLRYGKGFDPELGYNPFSYFNQVAWRAFQQRIKKEKRQTDIKEKFVKETYSLDSDLFIDGNSDQVDALHKLVEMVDDRQKAKAS
jgi:hypothetical protein